MAEPIKNIQFKPMDEEAQRRQDMMEIEDALLANKDSILDVLEVIGHLKHRGILDIAKGLLGQGDKVMDIAVNLANMPENKNSLKNLLLLLGTIGMINVTQLEPILLKLNAGIARVAEIEDKESEKTSYLGMARALRDPEINRSITMLLEFLRGMGTDVSDLEKNEPAQTEPSINKGKTQEPEKKKAEGN
ncbi:DUF1641 domain-containing protein [Siminovitchia fortis]|uniref:DUF1641 domain-containing protein n=1 Tax=Siminovitchia fortis TaxID=254758 RepID=A0A451GCN8_9BACI|nr:DUF1641 domain-containing protein [Siminovitchia fortis]RWR13140.1 DUF1641 domain-containing protein [Siminovitchia fortis]WHY82078.1 DUF1641 domain-containing protein [Siminovitchia fortis]